MSKFDIGVLAGWFRRPQTWGFIVAVAVCAAVSMAFFGSDALQGNILRQPDMQQGAAIGHEAKLWEATTGETSRWTNSLFGGMPNFQIDPSYPSSDLFSWLNGVYGLGLPAPANLLVMMMIGFLILMAAMRVRWGVALLGALAYGLSSYFVIIIGAGHIWKFVTLAYIPPTIAGLVLCYRGRYLAGGAVTALFAMLQVASNHVQMSYYFLFVMAAMALAYLLHAVRSGSVRRWVYGTCVLAAAGVVAVAANLPSLYNTYEYSKETMRGRHSELSQPEGGEGAVSSKGLDRNYITQYSYGRSELMTLLIPNVKGGASAKPVAGEMVGLTLADMPEAQELYRKGEISAQDAQNLQVFSQYFGEPEGTNGPVYIGAIVFALFLLGAIIVRGPMKWALVFMTVLSCGLALGRNMMWLTDLFIDWVPMYSSFRTVESILVIAEFTMPLLAALGLQKLVSSDNTPGSFRKPLLWAFGVPMALCLVGIVAPGVFGSYIGGNEQELLDRGFDRQYPVLFAAVEQLRHSMISSDAMRSFLFLAAAAGVSVLMMSGRIRRSWGIGALAVLVLADLFTVDRRYLNHESFCDAGRSTEPMILATPADREILADTSMNYRVMDIERFMRPDPSYFHKAVGGYHAAKLTRYQDLIDRHLSHFLQVGYHPELRNDSMALVLTGSRQMAAGLQADLRVLDMLNARYIVNESGIPARNEYALGNAWFVKKLDYVDGADAEMEALQSLHPACEAVADSRFRGILGDTQPQYTPGDTIYETSYAPNRLTYRAKSANGGLAVLSEVYFPWGWHATVDGNPVEIGRVNYVLRALRVPAGEHEIELRFDPLSLRVTDTVATVAVLMIFAAAIVALVVWLRRKGSAGESV